MPDLSTWRTGITEVADSRIRYRGHEIGDLIDDGELASTLWLLLFGTPADAGQADAFRRAIIAALDHGVTAPSTLTARVTASTRGPLPQAIAAGLVAFSGPAHGGAAEEAAKVFVRISERAGDAKGDLKEAVAREVEALIKAGKRMPGYGHPYHSRDPRVEPLMRGTTESRHFRDIAVLCESALEELTGKVLPMNADAAVAALLLDAGLRPEDVTLITALGRAYGLAAHAREEQVSERPFRAPSLDSVRMISSDEESRQPQ